MKQLTISAQKCVQRAFSRQEGLLLQALHTPHPLVLSQDHNRSRQANFFIHCTGIITSAYGSAQSGMVISYSSNSEPCTSHPVCANIGLLGVMPAGHSPTLPA